MKKILSIDGGGIRGIIPALILADIEKQTGKSIAELFDLIAGTSTGGLLALGLVKPDGNGKPQYSADALAKLYKNEKERIFSPLRLDRFDHTVSALLQERYGSKSYEDVLHNYFSDFRLSDALTEVIIMCYEIERRKPWVFRSCKAKDASYRGINENARMKDIARATSAAPTYFEPKKIEMDENFFFVDGGMFANNPAMYAYAEAKTLFPDEKDFLLVSLGTGEYTRHIRYEKAKDWGLVE
ncbi:patatin-like phospholipase family protein [Planococcus sp. SE5232]|uniref:patatin-like phospholipase family protein n=1 Tax=unclassified Planococcus (in: firmicutes) TaxID=2662419 RepID=UPI003D6C48DA